MHRLDKILSSVNDAIWAIDEQTQRFVYVNQRLEEIWEKPLEEIKNSPQKWLEVIHPDDLEYYKSERAKLSTSNAIELEYRIVVNNMVKWIRHKAIRIEAGNDRPGTLVGIITDISKRKEVEEKLNTSEDTFRYLFQKHPNPIWIFDRHTHKFLDVNEAAILKYGYSREEFLEMDIYQIRPEEEFGRLDEVLNEEKEYCRASKYWRHLKKDGTTVWIDIACHRVEYKGRDAELVVAIDVTDRVKNEEELIRREKLLSSLVDSHSNFMMRLDAQGFFTFANQPFIRQLGYTEQELIGSHFRKITLPVDHEICDRKLQECVNNPGKVVSLTHQKVDARGRLFLTSWEFIAISNSEHKVVEIQGVGRDITDEVKNREELETKERNLDALINNTKDLIWSIDKEQRLISANISYLESIHRFTGMYPQIGEPIYIEQYSPADVDKWKGYYRKALKGKPYSIVEFLPTEQGIKKAEISFNPIHNAEGEVIGVGCFARDITQRINYEEQILAQNTNLREIAAIASHDIRGPVASMLGLFSLLDRHQIHGEHNQKIFQFLEQSLNQLDSVIHQIVEISYRIDPEGIADDLKASVRRSQSKNV